MLAEAAELEHNLLCSYLYAAFSLKTSLSEGLLEEELDAVHRWRKTLMQVCMEEMTHLAQVANLMVAVGSRPHFDRPNLPIAPGYHPARIQVALAPFDLDTLDHFIYLERPETSTLEDAPSFRPTEIYERRPETGALMPSAPDYATIGEFYELLSSGLKSLVNEMGEEALFLGPVAYQLHPEDIGSTDLSVVTNLKSAEKALHLIVVQGEGAAESGEHSHFEAFTKVKQELVALTKKRASFVPSRAVARNPAMRRPLGGDRIHVTAAPAAALLDAANAVYALMLRCLTAVYDVPAEEAKLRQVLLNGAIGLMKLLGAVSNELTQQVAVEGSSVNAGITFTMLRSTEGLAPGVSVAVVLRQRFARIAAQVPNLPIPEALVADWSNRLQLLSAPLDELAGPMPQLTA